MRYLFFMLLQILACCLHADTMKHYMAISERLPQMEMKADSKAQAWARSARSVMTLTNESIAETLLQANDIATRQGHPLFCLPPAVNLNAVTLNGIIVNTYRDISSQQQDKETMTVSEVAWLGVTKLYPCHTSTHKKHITSAALGRRQNSLLHMDALF